MNVLLKIKELAARKKMSLAELERQAGLSSGSITKWGKSSPSLDKLEKVANILNVSLDYLADREQIEPVEDHKVQTIAAHIDDDVTEEQMEDILNYIEFIKQKHSKKD